MIAALLDLFDQVIIAQILRYEVHCFLLKVTSVVPSTRAPYLLEEGNLFMGIFGM